MKTTDVTMGCIIPVKVIEVSHEVFADEIESEAMEAELDKIVIDLNYCSWSVVAVKPCLGDMGFVDTAFDETYTDWYAINIIYDTDIEDLTVHILHELIDHIKIYNAVGLGKSRTQDVEINYRFVGLLPDLNLTSQ